jgi:molybdate transport system regulatory protein
VARAGVEGDVAQRVGQARRGEHGRGVLPPRADGQQEQQGERDPAHGAILGGKGGARYGRTAITHKPDAASLRLQVRVGGVPLMGPGRAALLATIAETGSISAAGRRLGMSYKRAWQLADAMNAAFASPLVQAAKGGAGGGGAGLTELGMAVLDAWQRLERGAAEAGAAELAFLGSAALPRGDETA